MTFLFVLIVCHLHQVIIQFTTEFFRVTSTSGTLQQIQNKYLLNKWRNISANKLFVEKIEM